MIICRFLTYILTNIMYCSFHSFSLLNYHIHKENICSLGVNYFNNHHERFKDDYEFKKKIYARISFEL